MCNLSSRPSHKKYSVSFSAWVSKTKASVTQLLEVFQNIGQALDRGVDSDIIYLDFPKSFDSVCTAKSGRTNTQGLKITEEKVLPL